MNSQVVEFVTWQRVGGRAAHETRSFAMMSEVAFCAASFATTPDRFGVIWEAHKSWGFLQIERRVENKRHTASGQPSPPAHQMGVQSPPPPPAGLSYESP